MSIVIEPLSKRHDRAAFSCGSAELDGWFHRQARQDDDRNISRVFVAAEDRDVLGFYTLSSFSLDPGHLPPELTRRLPRYEAIPAALIGRLARDTRVRGQGLGTMLMMDAMARTLAANDTLATFAMVVDAKDERAAAFYASYGFQPFAANAFRLFLPLDQAAKAFGF